MLPELTALRQDPYSKTYDKGGGKRRLVIGEDSHYLNKETGLWEDVDFSRTDPVLTSGFSHYFSKGRFRYEMDDTRGIIRAYPMDGQAECIEMRADAEKFTPVQVLIIGKTQIKVTWTKPSTVYNIYLSDTGIKTEVILQDDKASNKHVLGFSIKNLSVDGKEIEGGAVLGNAWLKDSSEIEIEGGIYRNVDEIYNPIAETVTLTADLSDLTFPVFIDPQIIVQPSNADSMMRSGQPTTNFGSFDNMRMVGDSNKQRSIFSFDFSAIPDGQEITAAEVSLYAYISSYTGQLAGLFRGIRTDWNEFQVTWDDYKAGSAWTTGGGDFTTDDSVTLAISAGLGFKTWTGMANLFNYAYINDGKIMHLIGKKIDEDENVGARFRTREWSTASQRPKATIDYEPVSVGAAAYYFNNLTLNKRGMK
jgi:hypothetical protein